jgi:lipopolysaccharide/colanic/teichoic acid biosynthesis glycosyltransferase
VGFVDDSPVLENIEGLPVLGGFSSLKKIIQETGADKLFIAVSQITSERVVEILNICRETGCKFQVIPSIYETALERVTMTDVEGIPLIGIQVPRPSLRIMAVKRIFDFFLSVILIVLLFPLALIFFLFVYFYRSRVIIKDQRVGRDSALFHFYRLAGSVERGTPWESEPGKPKKLIKVMRKCGMGIYPQLLNVLKGDMSFVGPRAEIPERVRDFNEVQKQKLNVKPGITGMWDISPHKESIFYQDKDMDIYYIQNLSLFLDVIILLRRMFRFF